MKFNWIDAFDKEGWWTEEEIKKEIDLAYENPIHALGFKVMEYRDFVVLASDWYEEDGKHYGTINFIPKKWINEEMK